MIDAPHPHVLTPTRPTHPINSNQPRVHPVQCLKTNFESPFPPSSKGSCWSLSLSPDLLLISQVLVYMSVLREMLLRFCGVVHAPAACRPANQFGVSQKMIKKS
jgi:hypothetical protein